MEYKKRIDAIIARAERVRLPLGDVAAAGGVSKSTLYRWRQDDANPRMRSMYRALDAMEARLAAEEQKLLAELATAQAEAAA